MNSTEKYIGRVYRITSIDNTSLWQEKQSALIGYRGELVCEGTNRFYTIKMIEGPHTGQTISIYGAHLRQASTQVTCRCAALPFPHRAGSGDCPTDNPDTNAYLEGIE